MSHMGTCIVSLTPRQSELKECVAHSPLTLRPFLSTCTPCLSRLPICTSAPNNAYPLLTDSDHPVHPSSSSSAYSSAFCTSLALPHWAVRRHRDPDQWPVQENHTQEGAAETRGCPTERGEGAEAGEAAAEAGQERHQEAQSEGREGGAGVGEAVARAGQLGHQEEVYLHYVRTIHPVCRQVARKSVFEL